MNKKPFWSSGEPITFRGVGSKVLWAYPTIVVEDTADLIALYLPAGVLGKNTDHRVTPQELLSSADKINIVDHQWHRTDVLFLIMPEDSFCTYVMWEAGTKNLDCWYINLQEPIRRTEIGFDTMDHILDIVVDPNLENWRWKDEDEFAEAQKIGFYSSEKADQIRAEGERAVRLVTSERRALYENWVQWQANPEWDFPKLSSLWDKVGF